MTLWLRYKQFHHWVTANSKADERFVDDWWLMCLGRMAGVTRRLSQRAVQEAVRQQSGSTRLSPGFTQSRCCRGWGWRRRGTRALFVPLCALSPGRQSRGKQMLSVFSLRTYSNQQNHLRGRSQLNLICFHIPDFWMWRLAAKSSV